MRLAALNATSCHAATYAPRLVRAASSLSPHKVFPCLPNTYLSPPRQTPNPDAKDIAVLGGGITGLTTAYHLARALPDAKISIFERAGRLGGWVDSELIDVGPDESVLFEWGPRSLRPDMFGPGLATLQLLADISLGADAVFTLKSQPAAQNRFVYYGDRLTRMPSPYGNPLVAVFGAVKSLLTEPIFKGALTSLLAELTVKQRSTQMADESVGDFLKRRFGIAAADNLASALFHGVYAGDIYQLSARTCLPLLWYLESRDHKSGSILLDQAQLLIADQKLVSMLDFRYRTSIPDDGLWLRDLMPVWQSLQDSGLRSAIYTLAGGLGSITDRLVNILHQQKNVEVHLNTNLQSLSLSSDSKSPRPNIQLQRPSSHTATDSFDYVVSTLRPGTMMHLLANGSSPSQTIHRGSGSLLERVDKAATVMVVNLYYDSEKLIPEQYAGFGYLIPRSVALDQNPERALGVLFGSTSSGPGGPGVQQGSLQPSEEMMKKRRDSIRNITEHYTKEFPNRLKHLQEMRSRIDSLPDEKTALHYENALAHEEYATVNAERQQKALEDYAETLINYPSPSPLQGQDTARGTKITVMLGGHWWNGWADSDLPDEQEGIEMAKRVLLRHIRISEQPAVAKARLQRDCIPQYPVGYRDHMAKIHEDLLIDPFKGRVKLAGPWWQGAVGVNDCIRKARETAFAIQHKWDDRTGLEDFVGKEKWLLIDKRTGLASLDPACEGWE